MNSLKWKAKRRATQQSPAEISLKAKRDLTLQLMNHIGRKSASVEKIDSGPKLAQLQPLLQQFNTIDGRAGKRVEPRQSTAQRVFSQTTAGGGSIQNNISVAINYNVHQPASFSPRNRQHGPPQLQHSCLGEKENIDDPLS